MPVIPMNRGQAIAAAPQQAAGPLWLQLAAGQMSLDHQAQSSQPVAPPPKDPRRHG